MVRPRTLAEGDLEFRGGHLSLWPSRSLSDGSSGSEPSPRVILHSEKVTRCSYRRWVDPVPIWTAGRRTFSPAERRVWQISSVAGDTRAILESHGGCRKTRASKASSDASTKSDHGPADTDPTSISGADTITLVTRLTRMSYLPGPYPVAHVHASADALPIRSLDRQMIEL